MKFAYSDTYVGGLEAVVWKSVNLTPEMTPYPKNENGHCLQHRLHVNEWTESSMRRISSAMCPPVSEQADPRVTGSVTNVTLEVNISSWCN